MKIAVLAVQGAFVEHERMIESLGVKCIEIRKREDWNQEFDGLIIPGGESSVMGKLLHDLDLFHPIKDRILSGLPVLGTCAGLILLAECLSNDETVHFGTMPITVRRNAYGRQLGSFCTVSAFEKLGKVPMTFIRAPYIEKTSEDVEVLAVVNNKIVGVRYKNQIGISFHPELDEDVKIHQYFLNLCSK